MWRAGQILIVLLPTYCYQFKYCLDGILLFKVFFPLFFIIVL